MIEYEKVLNKQQLEVVKTTEGPVLVQAGAGTGKTCTLVHRVAYLIEQGTKPESILLLTFTRKAAEEMLTRAAQLLDERCTRVIGGTYHSFALAMLKKHLGLSIHGDKFTILSETDDKETINIARDLWFEQEGISKEEAKIFPDVDTMQQLISLHVNTQQPMESIIRKAYGLEEEGYPGDFIYRVVEGMQAIKELSSKFRFEHNLFNFDDLLEVFKDQLEKNPEFCEAVTRDNRYIMVDEYQDNNRLQAAILRLLCKNHQNIMIVGDAMQSIYGFRGSNSKSMQEFKNDFPKAKIIKLHQNYRSVQNVLDFSNEIMQHLPSELYNPLRSNKGPGASIDIVLTSSEFGETNYIVDAIRKHLQEGGQYKDIAVLTRSGYLSHNLELRLRGEGIPFVKVGGKSIIELNHTQDFLAICRILVNPKDTIAWNRVLKLMDGLGPATASKLADRCKHLRYDILKNLDGIKNRKRLEPQLQSLYDLIMDLKIQPYQIQINKIISYYIPICKRNYAKDSMDINKRLYQLRDVEQDALRYKSLEEYLESYALNPQPQYSDTNNIENDNVVTISTVHSAKGLEWKKVFVLRVIDGAFPSRGGEEAEEKRLFYVAVTRAKEQLTLLTSGLPKYTNSSYINTCSELPVNWIEYYDDDYDYNKLVS